MSKENPYGKTGDFATKQIIDRMLVQHFDSSPNKQKSIGEIEDEILAHITQKATVIDFGAGESCDFPGSERC